MPSTLLDIVEQPPPHMVYQNNHMVNDTNTIIEDVALKNILLPAKSVGWGACAPKACPQGACPRHALRPKRGGGAQEYGTWNLSLF